MTLFIADPGQAVETRTIPVSGVVLPNGRAGVWVSLETLRLVDAAPGAITDVEHEVKEALVHTGFAHWVKGDVIGSALLREWLGAL